MDYSSYYLITKLPVLLKIGLFVGLFFCVWFLIYDKTAKFVITCIITCIISIAYSFWPTLNDIILYQKIKYSEEMEYRRQLEKEKKERLDRMRQTNEEY